MIGDDHQVGQGRGENGAKSPGGYNFISSKAKIEQRALEAKEKNVGDVASILKNHEARIAHIENIKPIGTKGVKSKGGTLKQGLAFYGTADSSNDDAAAEYSSLAGYIIYNGAIYNANIVIDGELTPVS